MSELLSHHFAAMSDRQVARKLLSLADFIGKNETGIAKEKSIALLVVAAARVKSKKERLREGIDELARKITANAAEVARENQRLRKLNAELLAALIYRCAECNGWGTFRCQWYNKDGDMCRMAQSGTCDAWKVICMATGHDPATPWEVEK